MPSFAAAANAYQQRKVSPSGRAAVVRPVAGGQTGQALQGLGRQFVGIGRDIQQDRDLDALVRAQAELDDFANTEMRRIDERSDWQDLDNANRDGFERLDSELNEAWDHKQREISGRLRRTVASDFHRYAVRNKATFRDVVARKVEPIERQYRQNAIRKRIMAEASQNNIAAMGRELTAARAWFDPDEHDRLVAGAEAMATRSLEEWTMNQARLHMDREGLEAATAWVKGREDISIDARKSIVNDLEFLTEEETARQLMTRAARYDRAWDALTAKRDAGELTYHEIQTDPELNDSSGSDAETRQGNKKTLIKQLKSFYDNPNPVTRSKVLWQAQQQVLAGMRGENDLRDVQKTLAEMRYENKDLSHDDYLALRQSLEKPRPVHAAEAIKAGMTKAAGSVFKWFEMEGPKQYEQVARLNQAVIEWVDQQTEAGRAATGEEAFKFASGLARAASSGNGQLRIDNGADAGDREAVLGRLPEEVRRLAESALANGVSWQEILETDEVKEALNE